MIDAIVSQNNFHEEVKKYEALLETIDDDLFKIFLKGTEFLHCYEERMYDSMKINVNMNMNINQNQMDSFSVLQQIGQNVNTMQFTQPMMQTPPQTQMISINRLVYYQLLLNMLC